VETRSAAAPGPFMGSCYDLIPPVADAGTDKLVLVNQPVVFDASNSTDNYGIATYTWDIDVHSNSAIHVHAIEEMASIQKSAAAPMPERDEAITFKKVDAKQSVSSDSATTSSSMETAGHMQLEEAYMYQNLSPFPNEHVVSVGETYENEANPNVDLVGKRAILSKGYSKPGLYTVRVIVTDAAGNDPVADTIKVRVVESITSLPTASSEEMHTIKK